jgi:hypothetical protein
MIGCHEMVHYVQARQITGLPKTLEVIFGYLVTPQDGLDSWFWEGLAVYYETRLQRGIGRLGAALWRGTFEAGVAKHGISEGDLDSASRRVPYGPQYLVGSHFIDWLVARYGEKKVWDVIARQSDEILFPLGVSGRFTNAFGEPLSALFKDFRRDAANRYVERPRPAGQRVMRQLDQYARLAVAPNGTWAVIDSGLDTQPRLVVTGADGAVKIERNLTDLVPPRALVAPHALVVNGLSFARDGRELWFVVTDIGRTYNVTRLARFDVETRELTIVTQDLSGPGGSISADGSTYWFSRPRGDEWDLAAYDVARNEVHIVAAYGPRTYVVSPRISPNGKRIAAVFAGDDGMETRILDAADGRVLARIAGAIEPSWIDDESIVYAGEHDGRLDVFRAGADGAGATRITDAPHLAYSPFAARGRVLFLNREGWIWTVDETPLDGSAPNAPRAPLAPSEAVVNAAPARNADVVVWRDSPYRATDHLFVPTLRGPSFASNGQSTAVGVGLSGGDRLGYHRWGLEGSWDFDVHEPNGSVGYINGQLAPVMLGLAADRSAHLGAGDGVRHETTASALVSRRFWTTNVSTGFRYDDVREQFYASKKRAAGPLSTITYTAAESTPAAGVRRAIILDGAGTYFPAIDAPAFGDARFEITGVAPLPLSRRHTIMLDAAGRALPGLSRDDRVLEVGGFLHSARVSSDLIQRPRATAGADLPDTLSFTEPLRGFEDFPLYGTRVVTGQLAYRLPILFDWGSATSLSIFPSFLFRQIDVEAFGSGASLLDGSQLGVAAGGALVGRFKLWIVPIDLGIQVARRFTYDEGVSVTFVGTGAE